MSLMGSLYVGTSGLSTSQNSLNTTAHNLANVDTKGYTRQQVVQADSIYNTVGPTMAIGATKTGLGVTLAEVRQVRDRFIDAAYRLEAGREAFYTANYQTMEEMESFFGEMEGVEVQTSLTELWSAISELAKQPNDTTQLAMLKQKAAAFVERCNDVAIGLNDYQDNIEVKVAETVDRINDLGQQIHMLNKNICTIEASGIENANDLRDARNRVIDELSALIKTDYKEDANGMVTVRAENVDFVTTSGVWEMGQRYDKQTGMTTPIWSHLKDAEVFDFSVGISTLANTDVGKLKAYVLARGVEQADYTDMPIQPDADNAEKYPLGTSDPAYQTDLQTYNDKMKHYNTYISNSTINNIQTEFDQLFHGIVSTINDILCPNEKVTLADGSNVWILDEENCSYGANKEIGVEMFSRNGYERYTVQSLTLEDGTTQDFYVYNEEVEGKRGTLYTVGNVVINPTVMQNVNTLGMTTAQGEADKQRADALLNAWSNSFAKLNPYSSSAVDYQTYYIQLIGEIGNLGSIYSSISEALTSTTGFLEAQRSQVAGVSSDEELTNMVRFQNAYNASSRYINVVSEMLEHIISQLGTR